MSMSNARPSSESAARYMLHLAGLTEEPALVTHLQLQKLMYFAQGWSFGVNDRPLFHGQLEAWVHGPVVAELYPLFADYGSNPIAAHEAKVDDTLSRDDRALIESVWNEYGRFSAWQLRELSHDELPWKAARAGLPDAVPSKSVISESALRERFSVLRERRLAEAGLDGKELIESRREAATGRTIPWEDVVKAFRRAALGS